SRARARAAGRRLPLWLHAARRAPGARRTRRRRDRRALPGRVPDPRPRLLPLALALLRLPAPESFLQEGRWCPLLALAAAVLEDPVGARLAVPVAAATRSLRARGAPRRALRRAAGRAVRDALRAHLGRDQLRDALPLSDPAGAADRLRAG